MNRFMKRLAAGLVIGLVVMSVPSVPSWALTDTENVGVSAIIPLRSEISIIRDANSVTRGSLSTVLLNRYDDQDGQPDGNALFMYAPYRSETGKNWHLASIIANGSTMTLSADVTGSAGTTPLADILDVFCGGFFEPFLPPNEKGGKSTDWELLDTFERSFNEPLTATAPFNYRLRLRGVVAGTHSGAVIYTLVSTL